MQAALRQMISDADAATKGAVAEAAHLVEAKAKANAAGRPGPRVVSGDLRRSIHVDGPIREGTLGYSAQVGPSVIYARRIELGFVGTDSIGRHYNQQPYPYLRPGFDEAKSSFDEIFTRNWGAAARGG